MVVIKSQGRILSSFGGEQQTGHKLSGNETDWLFDGFSGDGRRYFILEFGRLIVKDNDTGRMRSGMGKLQF